MFDTTLPDSGPSGRSDHVVKLAISKVDEWRRRVQNDTLGHRGPRTDPL